MTSSLGLIQVLSLCHPIDCSPPGSFFPWNSPGIEPWYPALKAVSLPSEPPGKPNWELWVIIRKNESLEHLPGWVFAHVKSHISLDLDTPCQSKYLLRITLSSASSLPFSLLDYSLRCTSSRTIPVKSSGLQITT